MSETVTQLLDRYDDDLMELARLSTQGMFDKDLYASASEARQQIVDLVAAARREEQRLRVARRSDDKGLAAVLRQADARQRGQYDEQNEQETGFTHGNCS